MSINGGDLEKRDKCQKWILDEKIKKRNLSWDDIRAGKCFDFELPIADILKFQCQVNGWPEFTEDTWSEFVDEMEKTENEQIKISRTTGELPDANKSNGLYASKEAEACWQHYFKYLKYEKHWNDDSLEEVQRSAVNTLQKLSSKTVPDAHTSADDSAKQTAIQGLVLGYVQSGKTANMQALMSMAADWGWNFFIVLSGTIENLRQQTLKRMTTDLNFCPPGSARKFMWQSASNLRGNMKSNSGNRAQDWFIPGKEHMRYLTVCLKNKKRLQDLIDWIHKDANAHSKMKIMIIDDEADQASISNTVKKDIRKGINELIVDLVQDRHYEKDQSKGTAECINYVMYTATPYANFLNEGPENESLYPKNFIIPLVPSSEYIGPEQICWLKNEELSPEDERVQGTSLSGLRIIRDITSDEAKIIDQLQPKPSKGKKKTPAQPKVNMENLSLPQSMKDAVAWFYCSVARMRLWGWKTPVSMLIHTSMLQGHHKIFADKLLTWINSSAKEDFVVLCEEVFNREKKELPIDKWKEQLPRYGYLKARDGKAESWPSKDAIKDYGDFSEIKDEILSMLTEGNIDEISLDKDGEVVFSPGRKRPYLMVDNCSKDEDYERLEYPESDQKITPAPAVIVIGGNTLARGLTLEGLVSSYFYRDSMQYDSLMQMGRWFGFRRGYELLPRVWMNKHIREKFDFMANTVEKSMRESLRRYAEEGISPSEYGPRVKLAAAHLKFRPTSRNHMNQAEQVEANYFGATPQICLFDEDADVQRRNIERTENFIGGLGTPELSWNRKCIYWDNVSSADIRDKLLKDFEFSVHETLFSQQMFLKWLEKAELQKWNVIVAGLGDVDKNTAAASVPQNSSHYWKVGGYTLEKAERTRKTEGPQKAGLLNIGVLAHRPDRLADISSEIIEKHKNNNARFELNDTICAVRQEAERDQIPQLVIYRIDKDSAPKSSDSQRAPLNCSSDIIGLWFCLPGDKKDKKYDGEVTVRIKNKEQQ